MPISLEKLASYPTDNEKSITKEHCKKNTQFNLLTRKGVFSYDFIDSWVSLEEDRLPPIEAFHSFCF